VVEMSQQSREIALVVAPQVQSTLLRVSGRVAVLIDTWLKENGCWIPHTTRAHKGIGFNACPQISGCPSLKQRSLDEDHNKAPSSH
jgi:hypothetical protein